LYTLTLALSRWERARVRALGVLAEKFCQSISSITQKKTDGKEDGGTLEKRLMH
jgi:hypothetical protein